MIRSVFQIRDFFKKREALEYIDTQMLVFHGLAFGLFMVSTGLLLCASLSWFQGIDKFWLIACDIYNFGSFISQLFLTRILWSLGTIVRARATAPVETFPEVVVADFDDAEIQVTIWNNFVKKISGSFRFMIGHNSMQTDADAQENLLRASLNAKD